MPSPRSKAMTISCLSKDIASTLSCVFDADASLAKLLESSVGHVLAKECIQKTALASVAPVEPREISVGEGLIEGREADIKHVIDWLNAALVNEAPWLTKVNECGVPKKLAKCGSLDALVREADKSMLRMSANMSKKVLDNSHERVEESLPDGWTMVRLLTPAALDRESAFMQHCIGGGAYDPLLESSSWKFLSLRDPAGKPHATIEVRDNIVREMQGKQNKRPIAAYVDKIVPYLEKQRFSVHDARIGLVTDVTGRIHSYENLPDTLETKTSLDFSRVEYEVRLPRVIRCENLTLSRRVDGVPDEIATAGDFSVHNDALAHLPAKLVVGGNMTISVSEIPELPVGLTVGGDLQLRKMKAMTALPDGLRVEGLLDLANSEIPISEFPADMKVGGLNMRGMSVESFDTACFIRPPGQKRILVADKSKLRTIVGLPHFSILDIRECPFSVLPEGLCVTHGLDISRTAVQSIPEKAFPKVMLVAKGCSELSVPTELDCEVVKLNESRLRLPRSLTSAGKIELKDAVFLECPDEISAEDIDLQGVDHGDLPLRMKAKRVNLEGTGIVNLDNRIETEDLILTEGEIAFGNDVYVSNMIEVATKYGDAARRSIRYTLEEARDTVSRIGRLAADKSDKTPFILIFDEFSYYALDDELWSSGEYGRAEQERCSRDKAFSPLHELSSQRYGSLFT